MPVKAQEKRLTRQEVIRLERDLAKFANMMDSVVRIPFTRQGVGADAALSAIPVAGDAAMLDEVKAHLQKTMINDAGMLMAFARSVELFDGHSRGFFSQLLSRGQNEKMDIKKMGVFPVVHGVRALGLEARIEETNTFERIQKLMQARVLDEQLGKDTAEALSYLMDLRLKAGFAALSNEIPEEANQIDLQSLSTLERDLLKDALQVVKRFKQMIHNHFHLGVR